MLRASLLAPALLLSVLTATAQTAPATQTLEPGLYAGPGEGDLRLEIRQEGETLIGALTTVVPISDAGYGGCAGGTEGPITAEGEGWVLREENEFYKADSDSVLSRHQYCTVTLTPGEDGKLISSEENGCLPFHGAACGFTGQLERVEQRVF